MSTFSGLFGGASGTGLYSTPHMGFKSGKYYVGTPAIQNSSGTSGNLTAGTIYYCPVFIHSDVSLSSIFFFNSNSAASGHNVRMGIYSNSGGMPDSLIVAASPITLTSSSAACEVATPSSLSKGWVWLALQSSGATEVHQVASAEFGAGWLLNPLNAPDSGIANSRIQNAVNSTYGALPSTALTPNLNRPHVYCGLKVA